MQCVCMCVSMCRDVHRRGLRLLGQLRVCPPRLKIYIYFLNSITAAEFHVGLDKISVQGTGAWRWRLVRVSSDMGKICVQGTGAWRRRLLTFSSDIENISPGDGG